MTPVAELADSPSWPGLQPQDLVITLLGAYVHPHGGTVWSGGLVELLAEFGFSAAAARVALARLVGRDLLARVRTGRNIHYAVTQRGTRLLEEGDRRIFSLGRQPHRTEVWTVLWHGLPEERRLERARLARRLRFLGFGPVQDGMWMSPYDREAEVATLLADLGVTEHAGLLVGRPATSLDFRPFVSRAWDLDALSERYRGFTVEFRRRARGLTRAAWDDRRAFLLRTRLVHAFRQFPLLDPELPDDLMPTPRYRAEAVALFDRLDSSLARPAQRHFDSVTAAPAGRAVA